MVSSAGLFVRGGDVVSGAYSPSSFPRSVLSLRSLIPPCPPRFPDIYSTLFVPSHPYHVVAVAVQTFTVCCLSACSSVCLSVLDLSVFFLLCVLICVGVGVGVLFVWSLGPVFFSNRCS